MQTLGFGHSIPTRIWTPACEHANVSMRPRAWFCTAALPSSQMSRVLQSGDSEIAEGCLSCELPASPSTCPGLPFCPATVSSTGQATCRVRSYHLVLLMVTKSVMRIPACCAPGLRVPDCVLRSGRSACGQGAKGGGIRASITSAVDADDCVQEGLDSVANVMLIVLAHGDPEPVNTPVMAFGRQQPSLPLPTRPVASLCSLHGLQQRPDGFN